MNIEAVAVEKDANAPSSDPKLNSLELEVEAAPVSAPTQNTETELLSGVQEKAFNYLNFAGK
ncbi:hypothetical protein [Crinalium epipsammum]|uniref:hypothetical protein n=1 Tax=Crinalium epipsammum TaxID=241425 RepID=UPI0002D2955E|nr:hypothetical protein [Crinalium epipsammum]